MVVNRYFALALAVRFASWPFAVGIAPCPAGTSGTPGACKACPAGRYSPLAGFSACIKCPGGSKTPKGATACCPVESDEWNIKSPATVALPPGKFVSNVHVLSDCSQASYDSAVLVKDETTAGSPLLFNHSVHLATLHLGKYVHSCEKVTCGGLLRGNVSCGVIPPTKATLRPGTLVTIVAVIRINGAKNHQCEQKAQVQLVGFGCQKGTILAFLSALVGIIGGTIILGVIFEYFFHHRKDHYVEAGVVIASQSEVMGENNITNMVKHASTASLDMSNLPTLCSLHADLQNALQLTEKELPLSAVTAWSTLGQSSDTEARNVHVDFRISTFLKNSQTPRGMQAENNKDDLRKKLLNFKWKPGPAWPNHESLAVLRQTPFPTTEKGALPGADIMDAIEDALIKVVSCCRGETVDVGGEQLRLNAARCVLKFLMTRRFAWALGIQYAANMFAIIAFPCYAANYMKCETGYPRGVHGAWGIYILCSSLFGNWFILRPVLRGGAGNDDLRKYVMRNWLRLLLRFLGMLVSITDLYQDTSFPVIAGKCGFDLWWVSIWLVAIGFGVMQLLVQIIFLTKAYYRYRSARTAEERDRFHIEAIFIALRGCDSHVLVYVARPAVEERLGGHSSWAMKTMEARVAFLRFVFEDAEQSALQVIFLYWFESATVFDKMWVGFSTATSLSLSFTLTVQTLPEVRDWIWHQFLSSFWGARSYVVRYLWLFALVIVYRFISTLPWMGLCVPAKPKDEGTLQRLFLLTGRPPKIAVQEAMATVFVNLAVACVVSLIVSWIWRKTLRLSNRWEEWNGRAARARVALTEQSYNHEKRFEVAEDMAIKTEQDEDTWLEPLKKAYHAAEKGDEATLILDEVDEIIFSVVHVMGAEESWSQERMASAYEKLKPLEGRPPPLGAHIAVLQKCMKYDFDCANVRRRALDLLADPSFRTAGLQEKAKRIDQATANEESPEGRFPLRILHWSVIEELGNKLPRYGDTDKKGAEGITEALRRCEERCMVIVYVSHSWDRTNEPDTHDNVKAKTLVKFAKWLMTKSRMRRLNCDVFFWIDYCCMDTKGKSLDVGIAALPLFVAACTDIVAWRTQGGDRRCWAMVERLLAYAFCPGGLTPFAIDDHSFGADLFPDDRFVIEELDDFSKPFIESQTAQTKGDSKVTPFGDLPELPEEHRNSRKLAHPFKDIGEEGRPDDTVVASTQRRHIQRLVEMAEAIPALEVFSDRQPVEFGLSSVVELTLGPDKKLEGGRRFRSPAGPIGSKRSLTDATADVGSWLKKGEQGEQGDDTEKVLWSLVVQKPMNNARDMEKSLSVRPGDDEGVITLIDNTRDTQDVTPPKPNSIPSPKEIDDLFARVDVEFETREGKSARLLEEACTRLALALKADLLSAMFADDEESLTQALMRTREVLLPEKQQAQIKLFELQIKNAIASEDVVGLQMALRDAINKGWSEEDSPFFRQGEEKLNRLRVERLRKNALDTVRQSKPDTAALVSVVGVAKQRGWKDIEEETMSLLTKKFDDPAGGLADLLKSHRLGDEYGIRVVRASARKALEKRLEVMKHNEDAISMLDMFCGASREGCDDLKRYPLEAINDLLDRWVARCKHADRVSQDKLRNLDIAAKERASAEVTELLSQKLAETKSFEKQQRVQAAEKAKSIKVEDVIGAVREAHRWDWDTVRAEGLATLTMKINDAARIAEGCVDKDVMANCVKDIADIYDLASQHKREVGKELEDIVDLADRTLNAMLQGAVKKQDAARLLLSMAHASQKKLGAFEGKTRLALREEVTKMKESGDVDAPNVLRQVKEQARDYGFDDVVAVADEAIGEAKKREEEYRSKARTELKSSEDIAKAIEILAKANRRGWNDIADEASAQMERQIDVLSKTMNREALVALAQASQTADEYRCFAAQNWIDSHIDKHLNELRSDKNINGLLDMIQCGCGQDKPRRAITDMVQGWKDSGSGSFPANEAPSFVQAAQSIGETQIASDLSWMLSFHDGFVAAKEADDVVAMSKVVTNAKKERCKGYQDEAEKILKVAFDEAKEKGDIKQLQKLLQAFQEQDDKRRCEAIEEVLRIGRDLDEAFAMPVAALRASKLFEVVEKSERGQKGARGVEAFVSRAREELTVIARELKDDPQALQHVHDEARRVGLDDVADATVAVVGGSLPTSWRVNRAKRFAAVEKYATTEQDLVDKIQQLLNATYRGWGKLGANCHTQDRVKKQTPQGQSLKVEQVIPVENAGNYMNYMSRKAQLEDLVRCADQRHFEPVRTCSVSLGGTRRHPEDPVDQSLNECWLWHGTSEEGCNGITDSDFSMERAGKNMGAYFGRGLYFAESALKADEYVDENAAGLCPILLCRVMLGRVYRCAHKSPDQIKDKLEQYCGLGDRKNAKYDAILGDREKVKGTFREFIVFDNDQVYPEYIVWYRREPPFKPLPAPRP